jgi:hypothetical protein
MIFIDYSTMFKDFKRKVKEDEKTKSFYGYYINRNISPLITKLFMLTPITANQVTILMIIVGLAAAVLFGFGIKSYAIIASILLILQHTLDAVDGEVARYKNQCSLRGKYLDIIAHYLTEPLLFIGIMTGIVLQNPNIIFIMLGISATLSKVLIEISYFAKKFVIIEKIAKDHLNNRAKKGRLESPNIFLKIYQKTLAPIFRWPEYHFVILIGSIFYRLDIILFIYGIGLPLLALLRIVHEFFVIPKNEKNLEIKW